MAMTGLLGMSGAVLAYYMAGKLFARSREASGEPSRDFG
jgi:hypothetical protein